MKITSFELDANEINIANEFVDADPKYLHNSEYRQLDYFVNVDINIENYSKIFDVTKFDDLHGDLPNCNNELVDEFLQKFSNSSPKKKEHKLKELKNEDYLIYDVDEKQFYKKLRRDKEETFEIKNETRNLNSSKLTSDESPKIKVKVKKLPINIFDDHIL